MFIVRQGRTDDIRAYAERGAQGKPHCIAVWLPRKGLDVLDQAYGLWEVLAHECGHVADYQALDKGLEREFTYYRNPYSRRKIAHDSRPQEQRANQYVKDAKRRIAEGSLPGCDYTILEYAKWLMNN
jgi:hypothetical protein